MEGPRGPLDPAAEAQINDLIRRGRAQVRFDTVMGGDMPISDKQNARIEHDKAL